MKKVLLLILFIFSIGINTCFSIAYVSAGAGPANWNVATSWTPNGIPTSADNVTISAGHTILVNASGLSCKDLTISGILQWTASTISLNVNGNYTITASGSELGAGRVIFSGSGSLLVNGTTSTTLAYAFSTNRTILATSVINKTSATCSIGNNRVVTNLGTFTIKGWTASAGSSFINGTNATVNLLNAGFMNGRTFIANATGNTVFIRYTTGALPTPTSGYYNLTIAGTVAGIKTLPANTIVSNNLTINSTNTLNTNNFDLTVNGNFSNSGSFTASAGKTVNFNGTGAAQGISTTGTLTFTGLTIDNSAGVSLTSGAYNISEVLTISNGTFNTGGRPFTMTSTASQTARIAPITGSGAISGSFIIQRFITTRDTTWADMASPVQNTTFADWDAELPARYYTYAPPSSYPTQYSYDESADDFVGITTNTTPLIPGKGYEVFLTGDFSYSNLPNTTLDTRGVPNQGNQDLSSLISFDNAGSNLVGNPFASSISWSSVFAASSGIENYFDVYDFTTGNYNSFGLGDEIGSGQGFWVYTNSASHSLIINENAKSTSSNSTLRNNETLAPYFKIKVSNNVNAFSHELKFSANSNASNSFTFGEDRAFHKSPNRAAPNITCTVDGKKTNLNVFNSFENNYSTPIEIYAGVSGTYTLNVSGFEYISNEYSCITIEDLLLNKIVNLNEQNSYSFLLDAGETNNRFVIHFSKSENCKSMASTTIVNSIEQQVQVLPTLTGNIINFNFDQTINTTISVVNILGQYITETTQLPTNTQSINVVLPEDFSGMYIIKIENEKGAVTKKFVKK